MLIVWSPGLVRILLKLYVMWCLQESRHGHGSGNGKHEEEGRMKRRMSILLIVAVCAFTGAAHAEEMGWKPMDRDLYESYLKKEEIPLDRGRYTPLAEPLPESWDWSDYGAVTSARDQANCGSCWAFATTASLESHIIIEFGNEYDLSEQMLVSCYSSPHNSGCNGGWLDAVLFYESRSPRQEACYPYGDGGFFDIHAGSPPFSDMACNATCPPICYNVTDFYTLDTEIPETVKQSIKDDGPCAVAFLVYEDFMTYWQSPLGTPPWTDGVYYHASGDLLGGHGVLAFGWDDETLSYDCKNSWGETGPFGDGTFKMRTDQFVEAVNFKVVEGVCNDYDIELEPQHAGRWRAQRLARADDDTVQTKCRIATPFPERIYGGFWYTRFEFSSGRTSYIPEPIPNNDYLVWDRARQLITKQNPVDWGSSSWVDVESWIIDNEGVESEHATVRFYRPR